MYCTVVGRRPLLGSGRRQGESERGVGGGRACECRADDGRQLQLPMILLHLPLLTFLGRLPLGAAGASAAAEEAAAEAAAVAAAAAAAAGGGVTLSVFDNSAFYGPATSSGTIPGLAFNKEVKSGTSIELTGTLTMPPAAVFNFTCSFANTSYAFLWIDDHLICQDNNIYKPPTSRVDLPLGKLSKAALPVVLRAFIGPSPPPKLPRQGLLKFIGNYYDGIHGKAGPRALRYGPQAYGFTPESCAAACPSYEYIALQDIGGRFSRSHKACQPAPNAPGPNCTATSGFCSCDSDFSKVTSQGKVTAPSNCLHPIQACSYVNSVYKGLPAPKPAPLPPGSETRMVSVAVSWQQLEAPSVYGGPPGPAVSPLVPLDSRTLQQVAGAASDDAAAAATLMPTLAPEEVQRRQMVARLAAGWGSWLFDDMLALVALPSGLTVRPMICPRKNVTAHSSNSTATTYSTTTTAAAAAAAGCLDSLIVNAGGEEGSDVRVGGHAYDRSYAEIESISWNISGRLLNFRLRWGQSRTTAPQGPQLLWLFTPLNSSTVDDLSAFELRFVASYSWLRAGTVVPAAAAAAEEESSASRTPVTDGASTTFESYGLGQTTLTVFSNSPVTQGALPSRTRPFPQFPVSVAFATTPLALGKDIALTSDRSTYASAMAIKTALDTAAAVQTDIYAKYDSSTNADAGEVRRAVEAAVMWNLMYVPAELGPFAPVSRGWSFAPNAISHDWDYVIFDW